MAGSRSTKRRKSPGKAAKGSTAGKKQRMCASAKSADDHYSGVGPLPTIDFADISASTARLKNEVRELLDEVPPVLEKDVEGKTSEKQVESPPEVRMEEVAGIDSPADLDVAGDIDLPPVPPLPAEFDDARMPEDKAKKRGVFSRLFGKRGRKKDAAGTEAGKAGVETEEMPPDTGKLKQDLIPVSTEVPDAHSLDSLPEFEEDETADDLLPDLEADSSDDQEEPEIKGAIDTPAADSLAQERVPVITDKRSHEDDHNRRYAHYLDNLHRRIDMEMRERQRHVQAHERRLAEKEKDLEMYEKTVKKREFDLLNEKKQYEMIQQLRHQVEDQQITIQYQKQELKELESALQEKQVALEAKEQEILSKLKGLEDRERALEARENRILQDSEAGRRDAEQRIESLRKQIVQEDEAIDYVSQERDVFKREWESLKRSLSQSMEQEPAVKDVTQGAGAAGIGASAQSVAALRKRVEGLLAEVYCMLDKKNIREAKSRYRQIRQTYAALKSAAGRDDMILYNQVLELYDDIQLAAL
ncbi:MAG: hypothetical protein ACOCWQ_02620 [Nanoarchaeota archaeon]